MMYTASSLRQEVNGKVLDPVHGFSCSVMLMMNSSLVGPGILDPNGKLE